MDRVADLVGANRLLAVDDAEIATAVTTLWGSCAPTTFNRNRAAVASWLAWCLTRREVDLPGAAGYLRTAQGTGR